MKLPTIVSKSTLAWIREARDASDYSLFDFLHGYIYGRWPYFYIAVGTGRHPLTRIIAPMTVWLIRKLSPTGNRRTAFNPDAPNETSVKFANGYHGKVVSLDAARELVTIHEAVRLTNLETIIPYSRARDIILKNPEHLVALECPCRAAQPIPCLPLDVCLIVGEPFASFAIEHHAKRARWITEEEACAILKAEDERGHVHHAFFKDAILGRFYAICNCCSCCCGAMRAHQLGTPMLASSGYRAAVDPERCMGCGACESACQFHAIAVGEAGTAVVTAAACMGCGVCANHCPNEAVGLVRDHTRGTPLEITKLLQNSPA